MTCGDDTTEESPVPWRPQEPGEVPTLGYAVLDWMVEFLATPDRQDYAPFQPTMEQAQLIINFYAIDPHTGRAGIAVG